jgi:hypothetical protein
MGDLWVDLYSSVWHIAMGIGIEKKCHWQGQSNELQILTKPKLKGTHIERTRCSFAGL